MALRFQGARLIFQSCGNAVFTGSPFYNRKVDVIGGIAALNQMEISRLLSESKKFSPERQLEFRMALKDYLLVVNERAPPIDRLFLSFF